MENKKEIFECSKLITSTDVINKIDILFNKIEKEND